MATTKEPITHVNQWLKLFNASSLYRHEPSRMFEDYLDLVLCCFSNRRQEERYLQVAKRYSREELEVLAQLMGYHILIHEHQVANNGLGWYDMLGDIYMELASRSKTSRMGQFFTPPHVCTLMARLSFDDQPEQATGRSICDPAAGSGRMLLAMRALQPKVSLVAAADLDPICAKMCALNFWMHGVRGEVACMNSLSLEWRWAYHTHPSLHWPFVTFLDDSRKEESLLYREAAQLLNSVRPVSPPAPDLFSAVEEPEVTYRKVYGVVGALVPQSWGRARNALWCAAVALLWSAAVEARVGAKSHLRPRRPDPCAHSRAAQEMGETNSLITMDNFEAVPDTYLMNLATQVAERLRADGVQCSVNPRNYAVNVLIQRDDREQQGLWFSASRFGRTLPQHVSVHGLWPLYQGRENGPYSGLPTVSVSYGRDVFAASRDILRRFMPMYLPAWEKSLAATMNSRDRDASRESLFAQMNSIPGISSWTSPSRDRMEVRWPGPGDECILFTTYGDGTVNLERGTLRSDRLLKLLQEVSQEILPAPDDCCDAVEEPEESYGEPFRPCDLCGAQDADAFRLVDGQVVAPWEYHGPQQELLCCPGCGAPLRNALAIDTDQAA